MSFCPNVFPSLIDVEFVPVRASYQWNSSKRKIMQTSCIESNDPVCFTAIHEDQAEPISSLNEVYIPIQQLQDN